MRPFLPATAGALLFATLAASPSIAQEAAAPEGPKVGEMAPDFTIAGVTRHGMLRDVVRLSDYRGETVVIAFFPRARTSGCTVQMESYRDRYSEVFKGGRGVTLLAISVDPDTALHSWARDAAFPMLFGSDVGGEVGKKYGAFRGQVDDRSLFVVDPEGRISYVARPFRQMAEDAYTELAAAVDRVTPAAAEEVEQP